jgi:superfamily II DNA/RNA helicase
MPFSLLGLSPALCAAARAAGFKEPTPVQTQAIAAVLQGQDVLACAQTGSGKTAAFALPLLQRALEDALAGRTSSGERRAHTLVVVPTRELAVQVGEVFKGLAQSLPQPLKITVVFGGVSINPQMMGLRRGTDIVVATPGRLLDLVDHNALDLGAVRTLVLDEADRMLDAGFSEELQRVVAMLPAKRQNLFFSATFAPAVNALAQSLLHSPLRIDVLPQAGSVPDITQRAIAVDPRVRTQLLRHLLQHSGWSRALVFVATKYSAEIVADKLRKAGIDAEPLHGQLSQGKRTQVLDDFKASRIRVVVATDLAARGIDVVQLPVVVNYDLPRSADDYTHRIGRTGRSGEAGLAVSLVSADTQAHWRLIEKRQSLDVALETVEGFEPTLNDISTATPTTTDMSGNGGVKGKRPSKKDKLRAAAHAAALPHA